MNGIHKVDYINLFVSQLREELSSELKYCYRQEELEEIRNRFEVKIRGTKVDLVCGEVSKVLRGIDRDRFVLSIFTS